jgi:hypothetical protein
MTHINVKVPESFDREEQMRDQIELLGFEKQRLLKKLDYMRDEFQNIFESVKKHGYVELTYSGEKIVLVDKDKQLNQQKHR